MAIKKILTIYDGQKAIKILRTVSEPIEDFEEGFEIIQHLRDTVETVEAFGLSAPQIGINKRVIIVDIGGIMTGIINPVVMPEGRPTKGFDACLSIPNAYTYDTLRPSSVLLTGVGESRLNIAMKLLGMEARIADHEVDHLDGVLYIDKLKPEDRLYPTEASNGRKK